MVVLRNLTFGDVYVCTGQSNMQLMLEYTFERNSTISRIRAGQYENIRLFYGPMNFDYATEQSDVWVIRAADNQDGEFIPEYNQLTVGGWRLPRYLVDAIPDGHNTPPWCRAAPHPGTARTFRQFLHHPCRRYLATEFSRFYATCWYTFEALTDALIAAGETPPPFGLIGVAVGGTKIAQWVEWEAQGRCKNVTCCDSLDCTQARDAMGSGPAHGARSLSLAAGAHPLAESFPADHARCLPGELRAL